MSDYLCTGKKRETYLNVIEKLTTETDTKTDPTSIALGSLIISDIRLPLKQEYLTKISNGDGMLCFYLSSRCGNNKFSGTLTVHHQSYSLLTTLTK